MNIKRILRHLGASDISLRKKFPTSVMNSIENAIVESEKTHNGEIRFAVENSLDFIPLVRNVNARERAVGVFSDLRVWDTEDNNGVLIYLLLADRDVEIIADRGVNKVVDDKEWERICTEMEAHFKNDQFEKGLLNGITSITVHLQKHFPLNGLNRNELPDKPVIL